ncbi:MAG: lysophospholipase L1-like esterase [Acidobacteria bacterium]|nr:lysophospholipase L1-like esterase [Acidobacteriota bacterium]
MRISLILLLACMTLSCGSAGGEMPPFQNPSPKPVAFGSADAPLTYVVMGDSTAAGQGAVYERGIAMSTARALGAHHRVSMTNLGVSGALAKEVVTDQLAAARRLHPDLVLLSVSANDVTHLTPVRSVERSVRRIVAGLRQGNPQVIIVVTGSPDMGAPPRIPRLLRPVSSWRTRNMNRMFRNLAAEEHLTFAPIAEETGPLFRADPTLFAADRFHPNERGYATWIAVLDRAIALALG